MMAKNVAEEVEASSSSSPLLSVEGASVEFWTGSSWLRVVDQVSFVVPAGGRVGIVGESGSGKTMTGLAILGLIPGPAGRLAEGSIKFDGHDLAQLPPAEMRRIRGNDIAMVFQEPMRSLNPMMSIGDQIAEGMRRHWGWSKKKATNRAIELLDRVEIPAAAQRAREYPHHLSGGMRQRAMIALALACDPKLLIADEPTTALDVTVQAQIIELFRELSDERDMALLFITHDLGVVSELCSDLVVMYSGQVVETGDVDRVFDRPTHPYTEGLLQSLPKLGAGNRELGFIPGNPPDPAALPPGCRFQPRCPHALPICETSQPELLTIGDRQSRCLLNSELSLQGVGS
ncbi:ABC transporter ATP-binding protein [Ilumatobacter sp.]|uniref:ABC transporter ATP-binding protein n=1 Tax=Ilumatobacter sp. TaxID=1967498 RepID=UPI003751578A